MSSQDADVFHQLVQRRFHVVQFGLQACARNLANVSPAEAPHVGLHLVEERIQFIDAAGDFLLVALIAADELCCLKDLIRGTVGIGKAVVVLVVVVQV